MSVSREELRKAQFYLDIDPEETFEGYTKGDTWNGWACPYFEKDVAEQVAEHYSELHRYEGEEEYWAEYAAEKDVFAFYDTQSEEPQEFGAVQVGGEKLYPIGAYCWTWVQIASDGAE
ncbi:hypothetical protein [Salinibacter ruber]|uniref:hypothetical protein n=1 Tax=Salinibacter ruber TaxID=146919 RepID=UPI002168E40D|nr:hypothetical protein [Salinibacter ruber]MCS3645420.1 hypothetical protein [Salinibacter ruber]